MVRRLKAHVLTQLPPKRRQRVLIHLQTGAKGVAAAAKSSTTRLVFVTALAMLARLSAPARPPASPSPSQPAHAQHAAALATLRLTEADQRRAVFWRFRDQKGQLSGLQVLLQATSLETDKFITCMGLLKD